MRYCKMCNKELIGRQTTYCSVECRNKVCTKPTRKCEFCGKERSSQAHNGIQRKYCSSECYHAARNTKYESKKHDQRRCNRCQKTLPASCFGSLSRTCLGCKDKPTRTTPIYRERKRQLVEFLGGKCIRCNYDKFYGALQLHHSEPALKVISWNKIRSKNIEVIKKWAVNEKIVLLCSNCHAEEHWEDCY